MRLDGLSGGMEGSVGVLIGSVADSALWTPMGWGFSYSFFSLAFLWRRGLFAFFLGVDGRFEMIISALLGAFYCLILINFLIPPPPPKSLFLLYYRLVWVSLDPPGNNDDDIHGNDAMGYGMGNDDT
jgi:hypothetical protein